MLINNLKQKMPLRKILKYKNWRDVHSEVMGGKTPRHLALRSGFVFDAPEDSTVIEIIEEIVYKKDYNPTGFKIRKNDIVVDIGANIGIFSVFVARKAKKVIAIEPFPENVKYIKKNAKNNNLKNIQVIESAVSSKIGHIKLYISNISAGHLIFQKNWGGALKDHIGVRSTTLSKIMEKLRLQQIDFLKIDCEGAEGDIITSLSSGELGKINKIAMEFHDNVSKPKHKGIKKILEENGFKVDVLSDKNSPFGYLYAKRY